MSTVIEDEDLLGELRSLFNRLDPVEPWVLEQARAAYTWRTVDAELAELTFDSLLDRDLAGSVRDSGTTARAPRLLGFGAVVDGEDVAVEVEVDQGSGVPTLVGQILPPAVAVVEVQSADGSVGVVHADDLGRFRVRPVPSGPLRLRVRHEGRVVQTTWLPFVRD